MLELIAVLGACATVITPVVTLPIVSVGAGAAVVTHLARRHAGKRPFEHVVDEWLSLMEVSVRPLLLALQYEVTANEVRIIMQMHWCFLRHLEKLGLKVITRGDTIKWPVNVIKRMVHSAKDHTDYLEKIHNKIQDKIQGVATLYAQAESHSVEYATVAELARKWRIWARSTGRFSSLDSGYRFTMHDSFEEHERRNSASDLVRLPQSQSNFRSSARTQTPLSNYKNQGRPTGARSTTRNFTASDTENLAFHLDGLPSRGLASLPDDFNAHFMGMETDFGYLLPRWTAVQAAQATWRIGKEWRDPMLERDCQKWRAEFKSLYNEMQAGAARKAYDQTHPSSPSLKGKKFRRRLPKAAKKQGKRSKVARFVRVACCAAKA